MKEKVKDLVKEFVPERRRRNHNRPPWLSQAILRAIRKKKRLWQRDKYKPDQNEYKEHEKLTKNLIRNAKRSFEKKLAAGGGGNSRPFFAYVKQRTKCRPSIGPLKANGIKISGDVEMAELLNNCFGDVFTREDTSNIKEPGQMEMDTQLLDLNITVKEVKDKIRKLK